MLVSRHTGESGYPECLILKAFLDAGFRRGDERM